MPRFTDLTEMPKRLPDLPSGSPHDHHATRGMVTHEVHLRKAVAREIGIEARERGMHVPDFIALIVTDAVVRDAED
jgi:hypothetical protein